MFIAYIYCEREFLKDYLLFDPFPQQTQTSHCIFQIAFVVFLFLGKAAELLFLIVVIVHFLDCSSYFDVLVLLQVFWHAACSRLLPDNSCFISWCVSFGMILLTPTDLVVSTAMVGAIGVGHVDTLGAGQYLRGTCYKVGKMSHCFLYSWYGC